MALLDLQDMELPAVSGDPLMASLGNSDSNSSGGSSLSLLILCGIL